MTKIIAEIGLNHNGSKNRARNLVNEVVKSDVDGITLQIRESEFYDASHPRKVEFSNEFYSELIGIAGKHRKKFGLAICEYDKLDSLRDMNISFWKTLSWDISNVVLQNALQRTQKRVYISTGLADTAQVVDCSQLYANIAFIHTQLNYDLDNVNLKAIENMRQITGKPVAYGLHSSEHEILYMALCYSPEAIFFYVKDETDGEHPDDEHAIPLGRLETIVAHLKRLAVCVGDGTKNSQENTLMPADDPVLQRTKKPARH
jgi:sialic acid synthase SpsE